MVEVNLWSGLRRLTAGAQVVSVEGTTLREVLRNLAALHPGLEPILKTGISVSVNGVIETNLLTTVAPDAEVYLIQRVKGG